MDIIAHRGCAMQYPENTIAAFRASAKHVDVVEFDVRRCSTSELVVFHDETLARLTGVEGTVSDTSLKRLRALTVFDSSERIPRLDSVLEAVPSSVRIFAELKEPDVAGDALSTLEAVENDVLVSAFDPRAIRAVGNAVPTAFLFSDRPEDNLALASVLGCEAVHPRYDLCLGTDVVDRAHGRGLDVNAWTVRSRATAEKLRRVGVDGIITDRWDVG